MLYIKIQPQSFLESGEDFLVILPYIGMVVILFDCAKQFEQIVNILSTGDPM